MNFGVKYVDRDDYSRTWYVTEDGSVSTNPLDAVKFSDKESAKEAAREALVENEYFLTDAEFRTSWAVGRTRVFAFDDDDSVNLNQSKKQIKSSKGSTKTIKENKNMNNEGKKIESMKIHDEYHFRNFEPWGQGKDTFKRILEENKADEMDSLIDELYPEGIDSVQLNDILSFDWEWVYEQLGIKDEDEEISSGCHGKGKKKEEEEKEIKSARLSTWTVKIVDEYGDVLEEATEFDALNRRDLDEKIHNEFGDEVKYKILRSPARTVEEEGDEDVRTIKDVKVPRKEVEDALRRFLDKNNIHLDDKVFDETVDYIRMMFGEAYPVKNVRQAIMKWYYETQRSFPEMFKGSRREKVANALYLRYVRSALNKALLKK